MHRFRFLFAGLWAGMSFITAPFAQVSLPPPDQTDPVRLGIMVGSPPPADKRVSLVNVLAYPNARWAFHHFRELGPTAQIQAAVAADDGRARDPVGKPLNLDKLSFMGSDGKPVDLATWQKNGYTDAMLVLHRGRIVHERYDVGMQATQPHAMWSLSKSVLGVLAAMLIHEGLLDANATVSRYVPELAGSAWGDASLQQTLDMTTAVQYTESLTDAGSGLQRYLRASGLIPTPSAADDAVPRTLTDYLPTVSKGGLHGQAFRYKSVDAEVMAWVIQRATGKKLADLISERLWRPMGAQSDASLWLDPIGNGVGSVGMSATLRDLARFGELLRMNGKVGGRQVMPAAVVRDIRFGGDPAKFAAGGPSVRAGYSYHDFWWIANDADGSFEAKGLFGQHLHINPKAELVIVKFSSHPVPDTAFTHVTDRQAFAAIARALN